MKAKRKPERSRRTKPVTIGREAFEKISAVEGMNLTRSMKRTFQELDRRKLTAEQRRQALASKYGR